MSRLDSPWGVFLLLLSAGAFAQGPALPESLTLSRALELLEQTSPRTAADKAQIDVVAADRAAADVHPNPSVSYSGQRLVSGANTGAVTQHQVVLEQPLLIFNQRGVRRDAAELNVSAAKARVAADLADRRRQVREAFVELLSKQEQARVLDESAADLERVEKVVAGRASAGDRSRYDVARIEIESRTLRVEAMNAKADVEEASRKLAAQLGLPNWAPHAEGDLSPAQIETDFTRLWETALQQRPGLRAMRERQAAARGALSVAQRDRWPVPSISAGVAFTQSDDGVSAYFGLSLPLPLFDRNQGAVARATADIEAQRLGEEAELAETRAEIERAGGVLVKQREALSTLERDVVGRLPALRKMAEDAYREGQSGILELLDAFRSLKELRVQYSRQQESVKLAEVAVIAAAGLDATSQGR